MYDMDIEIIYSWFLLKQFPIFFNIQNERNLQNNDKKAYSETMASFEIFFVHQNLTEIWSIKWEDFVSPTNKNRNSAKTKHYLHNKKKIDERKKESALRKKWLFSAFFQIIPEKFKFLVISAIHYFLLCVIINFPLYIQQFTTHQMNLF